VLELSRRGPDPVSLSGGVAVLALCVVLALDQAGAISLDIALAAAAICAAAGAILVISGLTHVGEGSGARRSARRGGRGLRRDADRALVGGVLAGLARRLGIRVLGARIAFVVIAVLSGGIALLFYALAWAAMPADGEPRAVRGTRLGRIPRGWHLSAGAGLLTLTGLLIFRELGIWWSDRLVWPLVLAAAGVALLWGQTRSRAESASVAVPAAPPSSEVEQEERQASRIVELYRGGFGVALVVGAALLFLSSNDALGAARDAAFTAIVAIFALALILAPFLWQMGQSLAAERTERIRSQERADVAAHLHDSVLQTLTLVQKRAGDPREVAALARRQERELRNWLNAGASGGAGSETGLAASLRAAAEEVEDAYRVKIDVVTVGDCETDGGARAIIGAAREALTNAAKFAAEEGPISVYAEVGEERIEAYVRDRGSGFDLSSVPADRRGVRESIVGRMQRHDGTATIRRVPGSGTEVELTVRRSRS
jgi:signal transduction histidine kinase